MEGGAYCAIEIHLTEQRLTIPEALPDGSTARDVDRTCTWNRACPRNRCAFTPGRGSKRIVAQPLPRRHRHCSPPREGHDHPGSGISGRGQSFLCANGNRRHLDQSGFANVGVNDSTIASGASSGPATFNIFFRGRVAVASSDQRNGVGPDVVVLTVAAQ